MHIFTHLKRRSQGKTGLGIYPDGMVEHDAHVGQLLKKLDDLGIAENTIVMYSTDNGAEAMSWPDGGTTPFRGEKNTNWEGGYRVPCLIRWPGVIEPGTVYNDLGAHEDMIPTIMAALGEPDVVEKLKEGYTAGDKTFKVHLDGYNLLPYLSGRDGRLAAQGVPLLDRRRRPRSSPLRAVEDRLHGAARARVRRLAGAVRAAAGAQGLHAARPTRSSARTRKASTTRAGGPSGCSSSSLPRPSSRGGWRASRSSRRARSRRASASTR